MRGHGFAQNYVVAGTMIITEEQIYVIVITLDNNGYDGRGTSPILYM